MVGIAQLVEHRIVVPGAEGSSPFTHPTYKGIGSDPNPFSLTVGRSVTVTHQTLTLILWVRVPPSQPDVRAGLLHSAAGQRLRRRPTAPSPRPRSSSQHQITDLMLFPKIMLYAPVAQQAEHLPFKQGVRGSNPRWSTKTRAIPLGWLLF